MESGAETYLTGTSLAEASPAGTNPEPSSPRTYEDWQKMWGGIAAARRAWDREERNGREDDEDLSHLVEEQGADSPKR